MSTKVRLETWMEKVGGTDEMGRVLTFGDARIGHYFKETGCVTIYCGYAELLPQAIGAIAREVGPGAATQALYNARIVP